MAPRSFLLLSLATLAAVVAAVAAQLTAPPALRVGAAGGPAFAALTAPDLAVAEIAVIDGAGSYRLRRDERGVWRLPEQADYPVDETKVRALLLALAELKPVERKTDDPARLSRLQLEDVAPSATSRRVTVTAADGQAVADAILGRTVPQLVLLDAAGDGGGTYYRLPGDPQAWLGAGRVEVPGSPVEWLQRPLLRMANETVRRVVVAHPDSDLVVAERSAPQGVMELRSGLAAGETPDADAVGRLARGLDPLNFEAVQPAAALAWPEAATTRTQIVSFDGLDIQLELAEIDGVGWAKILPALAAEAPPEGEARGDLERQVAELRALTEGRAFQLPSLTFEYLTYGPERLRKPAE